MEGENTSQGLVAEGFLFLNTEDALQAQKEQNQIEYLNKRLEGQSPKQMHSVYEKLISERTFKTPVGILYLKKMQSFLVENPDVDTKGISMIPVMEPYVRSTPRAHVELKSVQESSKRKKENEVSNHKISVALNIILILGILVMFWMTMQSETPNMLNYKSAIVNKYAAWEQELIERERIVREKELEYKLAE